jgi:uncharacterized membrane protein
MIVWATVSLFLEQRYRWASTISGAIIALVGAMLLSLATIAPISINNPPSTIYNLLNSFYQLPRIIFTIPCTSKNINLKLYKQFIFQKIVKIIRGNW